VHRDIKPANILVQEGGGPLRERVKLCDLGLAKWVEDGGTAVTQTGLILGTPQYVAPEQALGVEEVDVRADLYSLGATLYHAVTGRAPFTGGAAADIALRRLMADPEEAHTVRPEVSPGLSALLSALLAREPAGRPPTPADARAALERVARGESPLTPPPAAARTPATGALGWGAAGLLLGALGAGGLAMAFAGAGAPAAPAAPAPAPAATPAPAPAEGAPLTKAGTLAAIAAARREVAAYDAELTAMLEAYGRAVEAGLAEQLPADLLDRLLDQQSRLDELEQRLAQLTEQLAAR
ncbi:MAG: protein kinase domain-containing protein, partial [Planctomycetota bacterium]